MDTVFFRQSELLLRIIPLIDREASFALKGGTAINFFVRDLPRISVDIDLVYLPIGERDESLLEISDALARISLAVEGTIPGARVIPKKTRGSNLSSGLFVRRHNDGQDRAEPGNTRFRISPGKKGSLSEGRRFFKISVECQVLSEDELYAGKICAALDRQHPRDLFDIMILLRYGAFGATMRVYRLPDQP